MSIKENLDAANAKISLFADPTWNPDTSDPYIRANQELWDSIRALKSCSENSEMPLSVLDTIPNSRLAQYGTYWYDNRRECAYEPTSKHATIIAQQNRGKVLTSYLNREFRNEELFQSQEVEQLFRMFTDTHSNHAEIENRCRSYLKDLEMKEIKPNMFTLKRKFDSLSSNASSDTTDSDSDVLYDEKDKIALLKLRIPPRGEVNNFDELKLQMRIHSEEIRALWDAKQDKELNAKASEFFPKPYLDELDDPSPVFNYGMVPNVQPWLNYGYPLRHSDFNELDSLSSEMEALRNAVQPAPPRCGQQFPPPPSLGPRSSPIAPIIPKEATSPMVAPPARRLYSAVLQNQPATGPVPTVKMPITQPRICTPGLSSLQGAQGTVATVAATTMSTDELDELEREAIEQYRPSNESLGNTSEDSIISAKFQELERLALEQYNSASATETCTGAVGGHVSDDNAGNVLSPPHEPPCGGKPNTYAAQLLAKWNVLGALYRSRMLGQRFR